MSTRQIYYVVAKDLQYGDGIVLKDLEAMKASMLKQTPRGTWTLVISIHGSLGVVATRGGFLKNKNAAGVYDAADIKRLFNDDKKFVDWRKEHGPNHVVLVGCQIELPFEKVIIQALVNPNSRQQAIGLGARCRPSTLVVALYWEHKGKEIDIITRSDWNKISQKGRNTLNKQLSDLNRDYGYFGAPAVPDAQILDYYFDEAPKGAWPRVGVSLNYKEQPGISFWKRSQNADFLLKICPEHSGNKLKNRQSKPPPAP